MGGGTSPSRPRQASNHPPPRTPEAACTPTRRRRQIALPLGLTDGWAGKGWETPGEPKADRTREIIMVAAAVFAAAVETVTAVAVAGYRGGRSYQPISTWLCFALASAFAAFLVKGSWLAAGGIRGGGDVKGVGSEVVAAAAWLSPSPRIFPAAAGFPAVGAGLVTIVSRLLAVAASAVSGFRSLAPVIWSRGTCFWRSFQMARKPFATRGAGPARATRRTNGGESGSARTQRGDAINHGASPPAGGKGPRACRSPYAAGVAVATIVVAFSRGVAGEAVYTLPLTPSGLQYLVNARLSSSTSIVTAALVVDTASSFLAVESCANGTKISSSSGDNDLGTVGSSTCVPEGLDWIATNVDQYCGLWKMDNGDVALLYADPTREFAIDTPLTYLADQVVTLVSEIESNSDPMVVGTVVVPYNITVMGDSTLDGWNSASGVLGLAQYPEESCSLTASTSSSIDEVDDRSVIGTLLNNLVQPPESREAGEFFALDLGDEGYNSTLEIGGFSESFGGASDEVLWSEAHTAEWPSSWSFPAFHLEVCGRSLLSNVSSSWPAVLATGSACLGLPEEIFDSLMAWLPVEASCRDGLESAGTCYVSEETSESELPWFSFRLSERGSPYYVPLSSLVLDEGPEDDPESTSKRLCVTRQPSIRGASTLFNLPGDQPFVTLGTLPLRSLYTVVNTVDNRVGFVQKGENASQRAVGAESCKPAEVCVGMQTFVEADNSCTKPRCFDFLFDRLDEETMTCKSPGGLTVLAWVVGGIVGVIELGGHFLRAYYGGTGVALRGHRHHQGWEFHTGKFIEACLAQASRAFGMAPHPRSD